MGLQGRFDTTTAPSFITKTTWPVAAISARASPGTATRSASLPGSSEPIDFESPSSSASTEVAALSAADRRHPILDHQDELASVVPVLRDAGIGPEANLDAQPDCLGEGLRERTHSPRRPWRRSPGGNLDRLGMIESGAIRVGIRYVPRSFINFRVSADRNDPCSIELTPAKTASRAA